VCGLTWLTSSPRLAKKQSRKPLPSDTALATHAGRTLRPLFKTASHPQIPRTRLNFRACTQASHQISGSTTSRPGSAAVLKGKVDCNDKQS